MNTEGKGKNFKKNMFFWNRDWREKSWKLFGAGWAGRWTNIKVSVRVPWTKERNPPAPHLARNSRAGSNLTLQIAIVYESQSKCIPN